MTSSTDSSKDSSENEICSIQSIDTDEEIQKEEIVHSKINKFKKKQIQIYNHLSSFCDKIIKATNDCLPKQDALPADIAYIILQYSNHQNIQTKWISIFHRLKSFSWIMKQGLSTQMICQFENKLSDSNELPSDARVSLMLCDGFDPKFKFDPTKYYWPYPAGYRWRGIDIALHSLSEWETQGTYHTFYDSGEDCDEEVNLECRKFNENKKYQLLIGNYDRGDDETFIWIYLHLKTGSVTYVSMGAPAHDFTEEKGLFVRTYNTFDEFLSLEFRCPVYNKEYFNEFKKKSIGYEWNQDLTTGIRADILEEINKCVEKRENISADTDLQPVCKKRKFDILQ